MRSLARIVTVFGLFLAACGGSDDANDSPGARDQDAGAAADGDTRGTWPGPYVKHADLEETRSFTEGNFSSAEAAARSGPTVGRGTFVAGTQSFEFDAKRCPVVSTGLQTLGSIEVPKVGRAVLTFDSGDFSVRLADGRVFSDESTERTAGGTALSGSRLSDYLLQAEVVDELSQKAYGPDYAEQLSVAQTSGDPGWLDDYTERVLEPLAKAVPGWEWSVSLSCGTSSASPNDASGGNGGSGDDDPGDCRYYPNEDGGYYEIEVYESTTCAEAEQVIADYEATSKPSLESGWTCSSGDLAELSCEGPTRYDSFLATPVMSNGKRAAEEYGSPAG